MYANPTQVSEHILRCILRICEILKKSVLVSIHNQILPIPCKLMIARWRESRSQYYSIDQIRTQFKKMIVGEEERRVQIICKVPETIRLWQGLIPKQKEVLETKHNVYGDTCSSTEA